LADRRVTWTGKDDGDITALCNPDESWARVSKEEAIEHIEGGVHRYYVTTGSKEADVVVAEEPAGKHLRADPSRASVEDLHELPDC